MFIKALRLNIFLHFSWRKGKRGKEKDRERGRGRKREWKRRTEGGREWGGGGGLGKLTLSLMNSSEIEFPGS